MFGNRKKKRLANAVFEGGGVKGIGIAGALTVAGTYYDWAYVAGTSAGSIIAALVAAGYTSEEIRDLVFSLDYKRLVDTDNVGNVPVLGPLLKLKLNFGLYKGDYIENWVRAVLKEKGIVNFGDLIVRNNAKNLRGRYRLRIIASDISTGNMLVLPQDIRRYGIDPDTLDVARAVRMSMSIPFFFEPVNISYTDANGEQNISYIVDGGVLSNYPVWLFDEGIGLDGLPTIGFKLVGPEEGRPHRISGPVSMFYALFSTMLEAHDNKFLEEKSFDRTIKVPTLGVRSTDFNISPEKVNELYRSGVAAGADFFKSWDYRVYLRKHSK